MHTSGGTGGYCVEVGGKLRDKSLMSFDTLTQTLDLFTHGLLRCPGNQITFMYPSMRFIQTYVHT